MKRRTVVPTFSSIVVILIWITAAAAAQPQRFLDVIVALDERFSVGHRAGNEFAAAQIARDMGLHPTFTYGTALFGFAARIPEGRFSALEIDPRVVFVNLDARVAIPIPRIAAPPFCADNPNHPACSDDDDGGEPAPSNQKVPWGVNRIGADSNANTGAGIHVYVIDTGIDANHPDLQANLSNGFAVESCKGGGCLAAWDDDNGHGTHVAGTVGAIDNDRDVVGVAPAVTLHAVKVLARNGSGTLSGVIKGVDWVAAEVKSRNAPAVANMSLGGSGSKKGTCTGSGFTGDDAFHKAVCNAKNVGVVFAVAAGNSGADAENAVPAAYDDAVITVSATLCKFTESGGVQSCDPGSDDWPSWSNWGINAADWTANNSAPVAIAAPGVSILSTWNDGGTRTASGTSMASPHVAGAAALFLKSTGQVSDGSAFVNARAALLGIAESTGFFNNTSGKPHDEDFLDAGGL
jgi:subtilisin